jgi:hypothetical protein
MQFIWGGGGGIVPIPIFLHVWQICHTAGVVDTSNGNGRKQIMHILHIEHIYHISHNVRISHIMHIMHIVHTIDIVQRVCIRQIRETQ